MADEHPPIHLADYGESGSGKSTLLSTFPKPLLLFFWDPLAKDMPYLRRGIPTDFFYDDLGTPVREVMSKRDGRLLIRIEYYSDAEPSEPEAYERFLLRMHNFQRDQYEQWKTVGVDSLTFMEIAARKLHQYKINPHPFAGKAKETRAAVVRKGESFDPRQWWAGSTDLVEEMIIVRFGSMPMNVVVVCHVDKERDEVMGTQVRNPMAPGRIRASIGAAFSEFYHSYVWLERDAQNRPTGERQYLVQTKADNLWNSSSQIHAPDPCVADYKELWAGTGL